MFGNDLFEQVYDHLDQAVSGGAAYVKQSAEAVKKGVASSLQWIWEALQGDFNPNQSAGQIAANAVLGLIPVVDQVLDCRDLIANARDISRDPKQPDKWVFLSFTLIGLIPSLGSAILNTAGIDAHGKGFGVDALNADNHSWVLSRMAVEFDCQPGQYTDYTIATWINEYGRVLSTRNFTLTDAAGTEFGRAVTQWAMIDLKSRSALDLSWVGDAHAEAIVDAPSPTDKPRKIRDVDPAQTAVHKVVYSDIDFNRHVNTMRYIEMMIDMLPVELLMQETPVRFDIHFLRECRYGQTLSVGYEQRGRTALFEIRSDEGTPAVRASIEWK